jgi:hypothetical protein
MKKKAQEKLAAKANPVVEEAPVVSEPEAIAAGGRGSSCRMPLWKRFQLKKLTADCSG